MSGGVIINQLQIYSTIVGLTAIALLAGLGLYWNINPQDGFGQQAQQQQQAPIAPEFVSISGYINTVHNQPLMLNQLHGYVVLLHFFRIQCPECSNPSEIASINYLYAKYRPYGLVVVGIQSPEFDVEKDIGAVQQFVTQNQIKYPVLMDITRQTFNEYGDAFWPRDTLVGHTGYVRYTHIGTTDLASLEQQIQSLIAQKNY